MDITTEPSFSAGKPHLLFKGRYYNPTWNTNYDVTRDGKRFLMIQASDEQQTTSQINVITNWFDEVRRRVPTGTKN